MIKFRFLALLILASLIGCNSKTEDGPADNSQSDEFVVAVVNFPLQTFAQHIAGEHAQVLLACPADVDPAHWQPDSGAIANYQKADVVFVNGLGYAHWLNSASLPASRLVDTAQEFKDAYIETDKVVHQHGPNGEHSHTGLATHVWLNPQLAMHQAKSICDTLILKQPAHAEDFQSNFDAFELKMKSLDDRLELLVRDVLVLASHPVYEYLADRCEWTLHSVVWEPDVAPSAAEWKKLAALAKSTSANWMLWEEEPLPETRAKLTKLGITIVVFHPCGRTESAGYFEKMDANISQLENFLRAAKDEIPKL